MPIYDFTTQQPTLAWSRLPGDLSPIARATIECALQAEVTSDLRVRRLDGEDADPLATIEALLLSDLVAETLSGQPCAAGAEVIEQHFRRHVGKVDLSELVERLRHLVHPAFVSRVCAAIIAAIPADDQASPEESR